VTSTGRWPRWGPVALLAVLVVVRVVAVVLLLGSGVEDEHSILGGDARRYEIIVSSEGTPYRDFEVEYPPVALALMKVVDRPTPLATLAVLAVSQLALELATAAVLAWAWSRRSALTYLVLGTPMVFFPFAYVRVDLLSVFLAVLGLALLRRRHQLGGGALLAVSVFAKIWPLVVAPAMLVRRQWRGLAAWTAAGVAALVAWVAWAGPDGISQILTFRGADGWQIESLPGIVLHGLDPHGSSVQEGAWRTAASAPGPLRTGISLVGLLVVAVAWWWAHRATTTEEGSTHPDDPALERRRGAAGLDHDELVLEGLDHDELVLEGLAPLAAVLAMLVFSTIISPQYVLWFLPFAALVTAQGERTIGVLSAVVAFLSMLGLGWIHGLIPGEWHAVAVIAVRNLALVALLAVTMQRLHTAARRVPGTSGEDPRLDPSPADPLPHASRVADDAPPAVAGLSSAQSQSLRLK
jgi:hypothetical protein